MKNDYENHLYRERQSDSVDFWLNKISQLESGEVPKHELTPEELEKLHAFEEEFVSEKTKAGEIKADLITLDMEFLKTNEGIEAFRAIFSVDISDVEIPNWLIKNTAKVFFVKKLVEDGIESKSKEFQRARVVEQLKSKLKTDGGFEDTSDIVPPENISLLVNTEQMAEKIQIMRNLKQLLKSHLVRFEHPSDNLEYAKKVLVEMYLKRLNVAIANLYLSARSVKEKEIKFGYASLSVAEKKILSETNLFMDPDVQLTRIDKFIFGASRELDEKQKYGSISSALLEYAQHIDQRRSEIDPRESIKGMGLDPEKVLAENIGPEELKRLADQMLELYGLGNNSTNPWKYEIQKRRTLAVTGDNRIIKGVNIPRSILDAITILLGHEIEGHVLQHENSSHIPLKIFSDEDGGGRSSLFAEGGAMYVQDKITKEIFGYEKLPKTSYLKTLTKRLAGGNFIDCVKTYFESTNIENLEARESGQITDSEYMSATEKNLNTAFSSTQRIFKYGDIRKSQIGISTRSKDLAYLEQKRVLDKMANSPLLKLAFVGGMNLETAYSLIDLGLLKLDELVEPKMLSIKIWETLKDKYLLKQ